MNVEDVKLVIKINEKAYKEILEDIDKFESKGMIVLYLYEVIKSGTPLIKAESEKV